jgi:hypothetical protein
MKHIDLAPLWNLLQPLLTQHGFLTVICGFLAVTMTLSFYRFLRSINPALVGLVLLLVLFILMLHWSQTRTEPAFLKPAMDWFMLHVPSAAPVYQH